MTRLPGLVLSSLGLFVLSGCGDIEWHWEEKPARPIGPSATPPPSSQPSTGSSEASPTPDPYESTAFSTPLEGQGYYQLVLLSERASAAAPPGVRYVQLTRASARAVGELLAMLYVPVGPAGTTHRYTLVYPTLAEWAGAAGWARDLDIPPVEEPVSRPPESVERAFAFGVGLLYATPHAHPEETDRLRSAEAGFLRVLNAPDQPKPYRWAAGMIAGAICAERLADYERAEQHLVAAQGMAMPESLEQMATLYLRARVHVRNGKPGLARQILSDLLARFGSFAASEVYDRADKTLAQLEGRR